MTLNGLFNLTHLYTNLKCGSRLECQGAFDMKSRAITDGQISASTIWSSRHFPSNARLHNQASANSSGAWEPSKKNANQWLQIDLVTQLRHAWQLKEEKIVSIGWLNIIYSIVTTIRPSSFTECKENILARLVIEQIFELAVYLIPCHVDLRLSQ